MSVSTSVFRSVTAADRVDYPALERSIQQWWDEHAVLQRYLHRNDHSDKQFSFLNAGPGGAERRSTWYGTSSRKRNR